MPPRLGALSSAVAIWVALSPPSEDDYPTELPRSTTNRRWRTPSIGTQDSCATMRDRPSGPGCRRYLFKTEPSGADRDTPAAPALPFSRWRRHGADRCRMRRTDLHCHAISSRLDSALLLPREMEARNEPFGCGGPRGGRDEASTNKAGGRVAPQRRCVPSVVRQGLLALVAVADEEDDVAGLVAQPDSVGLGDVAKGVPLREDLAVEGQDSALKSPVVVVVLAGEAQIDG